MPVMTLCVVLYLYKMWTVCDLLVIIDCIWEVDIAGVMSAIETGFLSTANQIKLIHKPFLYDRDVAMLELEIVRKQWLVSMNQRFYGNQFH